MIQGDFNLVDQPWIPVVRLDGTPELLSLRDTMARAHELREVYDPSPPVVASLMRLLVVLVHRVLNGPRDRPEWVMAWKAGRFSPDAVDAYLGKWRHRFDLFDDEYPFWQVPGLEHERSLPVSKLFVERSSGNNATLFDHSFDGDGAASSPAEAALGLLALQASALGGTITGEAEGRANASDAPFARPATVWIQQQDLFRTLLSNTVIYNPDQERPVASPSDQPIWERPLQPAARRVPGGYLDWLTWPARRVLLFRDEGSRIERAFITAGDLVSEGFIIEGRVPMFGFKARKKEGWLALRIREERSLWRDSAALLGGPKAIRPPVIDEFGEGLAALGDSGAPLGFSVLGVGTDQAKTFDWRQERLSLPGAYVQEPRESAGALHWRLAKCVELAEGCASALWKAAQELVAEYHCDARSDRFSKHAEAAFWETLDREFWPMAVRLAEDRREEDGLIVFGHDSVPRWAQTLKRSALGSLDAAASSVLGSYRGLRALSRAQLVLRRRLHGPELLGPYLEKEFKS